VVSYRGCPLILFSVGKSRNRPYLSHGLNRVEAKTPTVRPSMTSGLWVSVYPWLEYTSMTVGGATRILTRDQLSMITP
jgi:hypothetical protein